MAKEEEKKVITALYKVHLHCPKCAEDIKKPLLSRVAGVQSVDVEFEKGEVKVKGSFDEKEMHKRLEKITKQNVEIVDKPKITKEKVSKTTIKVFLHCNKCEDDLRRKLLKQKGIHDVKTDGKAQTITIEGTVEPEKLLTFMRKRVHKHAEIIPPPKQEIKKEEKKPEKPVEKKPEKPLYTVQVKSAETTGRVVEFQEHRKVEGKTPVGGKTQEGPVPYFVHYVYAPQTFSDENPNACSIM